MVSLLIGLLYAFSLDNHTHKNKTWGDVCLSQICEKIISLKISTYEELISERD